MTFQYFAGFGKCSDEFANQILIFNNEVFLRIIPRVIMVFTSVLLSINHVIAQSCAIT
jgi:hypothetical protein